MDWASISSESELIVLMKKGLVVLRYALGD